MIVNLNGITLFYKTVGQGFPLFMVHGNGEDHTIFDRASHILGRDRMCILPDSRGHGQSADADSLDYEEMARDMLALADELGLEQFDFYGFSDGGIIGLYCAMLQPERVRNLIVSGANTQPDGVKGWMLAIIRLLYVFKKSPQIRLMLEQPHITNTQLQSIRAHTLVLAGSRDLIRRAHTENLAASIPDAQMCILPGEDHGSYIVHSEKIAGLIQEFLGIDPDK